MILQMLPTIIDLVRQVETLIPGPKQEAKKLNFVLTTVNAAAAAAPEAQAALAGHDLSALVTSVVNPTVSALNDVGVFKKSAQT